MKVLIIGPLKFGEETNEEKYQAFADILKTYGIEPVIPHNLFDVPEIKTFQDHEIVKRLVQHVCQCDVIMTLEGWHLQRKALKVVNTATELEIEVIHEVNLNKWIKKHGLLTTEKS